MRMKKTLGIVLAASMLTASMAGCGSKSATTSSEGTDSTGKVVTLNAIMLKHPLTQDLEKMEWLTKIEKEAGVSIKWQQISADWDQKKGTLLASGDIPDLIFGQNAIVDSDYSQFPGLFQDFTELIETDAPNIKKMFSEKPETKTIATQTDGKIYGLPKYQRFWPTTATRQYINQKWLDKVGLKQPTNWDELYDVLVAFKTKDPNGNGKADEIAMDWSPGQGFFNSMFLIGGEGITLTAGSGDGFFVEDGKVKNLYVDARYKTLVTFLNKCFTAGLINPEVFTQDYTKFQALARGTGDVAKIGFTWGWEVSDRFGTTLAPQYASTAPLKATADYTGKVAWDYTYDNLNYGSNMVEMSAECENKDAAMKFIDKFYDPATSIQVLFGSMGTNISDDGGSYTVLPPTDTKMDPGTWKWTSSMADNGPMYIPDSLKLILPTDMQSLAKQNEPLDTALKAIDIKKDVWPGMYIKFSSDDNNTMSLSKTGLGTLTSSKWASWIAKGGVDKEWDAYVKNCEKAGLPELTTMMQKYYDDYMKSK